MYELVLKNFSHYSLVRPVVEEYFDCNRKIRHAEYLPFYSTWFVPHSSFPFDALSRKEFTLDEFDVIYGGGDWRLNLKYVEFIKKCIEKQYYNILFLLNVTEDRAIYDDSFSEVIVSRFIVKMYSQNITEFSKSICSSSATVDGVFEKVRLMNSWAISKLRRTRMSEESMSCLTNLLFLATVPNRVITTAPSDLKVLLCGMVKKENVHVVKAHVMTNTPIPSSMLELWVDESLESTANRLKAPFRKFIKSKAEASGMTIKVFPNLTGEILVSRNTIHNSLEEKKEWQRSILDEYYEVIAGNIGYPIMSIRPDINTSAFEETLRKQVMECMDLPF